MVERPLVARGVVVGEGARVLAVAHAGAAAAGLGAGPAFVGSVLGAVVVEHLGLWGQMIGGWRVGVKMEVGMGVDCCFWGLWKCW